MCAICGCDGHHEHVHADGTRHSHAHSHGHEHHHHNDHIDLETRVLAKNDALAVKNGAWLAEHGVMALNLMGAPGCGKTSLLERTIQALGARLMSVIEGDQETANDATRIKAAGAAVVQVNTGTGCHLDAAMVARSLEELAPRPGTVVVIENVGNLVCPSLFQLGERRRVVVLSVAEGDDKPLKYPHMFRAADLILINKVDLLAHVDFEIDRAIGNIRAVNPNATVLKVSAKTGEGVEGWCRWLSEQLERLRDRSEGCIQNPGHALGVER